MAKRTCSITGCDRPHYGRGWCEAHYARWRRGGAINVAIRQRRSPPTDGLCSIDDCSKPHEARGWCQAHYQRWHKHGDPEWTRPAKPQRTCSIEGCERKHKAYGWCRLHYSRWQRRGHPMHREYGDPATKKERRRAYMRRRYWANRDAVLAYQREWGKANRDKKREYENRWRRANPEKVSLKDRRRYAKEAALRLPFTEDQLKSRLSMFSGCWMCGGDADAVDHVKPLAAGGAHVLANLRPACASCNASKGATWPIDVEVYRCAG